MSQAYFLSVLYGALETFLLLSELRPESQGGLYSSLRRLISRNRRSVEIFTALGILIALLELFFPMEPGPRFFGDLVPALWLMYTTAMLALFYSGKRAHSLRWARETGLVSLMVTAIHFLFPGLVLI